MTVTWHVWSLAHMHSSSDAIHLHQRCEGGADVLQACCLHVSHPLMQQMGA